MWIPSMNEFDEIQDEIHEIRRELFNKTKGMTPKEEAEFYNLQAERILNNWGIKLKTADYLLKAVKPTK